MRTFPAIVVALLLALSVGPAVAAKPWNLWGEEIATFEATVVDVLCELTGDCPADCGGGDRQLGLRTDDGALRLVVKSNTLFAGGVLDLLPFCGRRVEVDGLLIKADAMTLYFVQAVREPGAADWIDATAFSRKWVVDNGAETAKNWWRRDPRVKAVIDALGPVGIPGAAVETE